MNPFAIQLRVLRIIVRTLAALRVRLSSVVTLAKLIVRPHVLVMLAVSATLVTPLYHAAFLAGAVSSGVLRLLAARPRDIESLADELGIDDRVRLARWLDTGVRLRELGATTDGCYRLRSLRARVLACLDYDTLGAGLEEVLRYHVQVLLDGPAMLQNGKLWSLSDQDGTVIARSTRVIQPLVENALEAELDACQPVRLLEIGCGSGIYVQRAALMNPNLTALAIDMQADVVALAQRNIVAWGLDNRVEVRQGDLRELDLQPQFDLITLHNNIYYFAEDMRVEMLRKARSLLAPSGKLLLTSPCQGGPISLHMVNLCLEYADFGGPLPIAEHLAEQIRSAGFVNVKVRQVAPGMQFRSFVGVNP